MDPGGNADHFLVEQIRDGREEAWRQLIDRYSGRLLAFARARTPGLSDAEDLVQETFIGFLQSLANYDASRSLETYLFTILRYKLYDLLRQRKLRVVSEPAVPRVPQPVGTTAPPRLGHPDPGAALRG